MAEKPIGIRELELAEKIVNRGLVYGVGVWCIAHALGWV